MIDDRNDSTSVIDEPEFNLTPPHFDESAAANAQPVEPIPASRLSAFHNRFASLRRAVTSGSRALILVVIAGLVTGALGGMVLVKERQVTEAPPAAAESVSESVPSDSLNDSQKLEPLAVVGGLSDMQSASPVASRVRKSRARARSSRATRAYLVDVIR